MKSADLTCSLNSSSGLQVPEDYYYFLFMDFVNSGCYDVVDIRAGERLYRPIVADYCDYDVVCRIMSVLLVMFGVTK